jgi:glucokinase
MMAASDKPSLMRSLSRLSPRTITECCDKGDEMAQEVYRVTGERLGIVTAAYATLLDPEAIIFTGGIANAGHWLFDAVEKTFNEHIFHNIKGHVKLQRSTIDDRERDVLGASALAWGIKEYSLFK